MSLFDRIILIDKPDEMTSFGVVARIRRVLSNEAGKKVKVGHCGTLDPFATGLLVLVTGSMTKQAMQFTKLDKTYEATIRLGESSTTGDPEGEITKDLVQNKIELSQVESAVGQFIGKIKQTPPIFSAIKIGGRRAYDLARQGKEVEIPEREITINDIEILDYSYPDLKIRADVSSGTYIRSLAVDIGKALGVGAYCSELRRTQIGEWSIGESSTLEDFGVSN